VVVQAFIVTHVKKGDHMKKIGLTGGIASGKSFAADYIKSKGYRVIDADLITKTLLKDDTVLLEIKSAFPTVFQHDQLDKKALADMIFSDSSKKRTLEAIIHPRVYQAMRQALTLYLDEPFVILDVPLLYETYQADLYDMVMVIYVDHSTQLKRLMTRDQLTEKEALARINAQMPLSEKIEKADIVIDNTQDKQSTQKRLDKIIETFI
jgi:dephospho-CoA kinase